MVNTPTHTEDTMTELIPGKRYAVTRIGTARNTDTVSLDSGGIIAVDNPNITVELLPDPLPTTPGSVIQYEGRVYIRAIPITSQTYVWTPLDDLGHRFDEGYDLQGATVLFDAGADRA